MPYIPIRNYNILRVPPYNVKGYIWVTPTKARDRSLRPDAGSVTLGAEGLKSYLVWSVTNRINSQ